MSRTRGQTGAVLLLLMTCVTLAWTAGSAEISSPMITEIRRPKTSATTPVGISKTKYVASHTVPMSTSWSGLSAASSTW